MDAFQDELPKNLELFTIIDQSISVDDRVNRLFSQISFKVLILVALVSLVVLGRGPSFVVVTAIPVSIFVAIGWLDLSGFALQQMSIVGLVIALGLLVDNAIVVTENVLRHQRMGDSPKKSSGRRF